MASKQYKLLRNFYGNKFSLLVKLWSPLTQTHNKPCPPFGPLDLDQSSSITSITIALHSVSGENNEHSVALLTRYLPRTNTGSVAFFTFLLSRREHFFTRSPPRTLTLTKPSRRRLHKTVTDKTKPTLQKAQLTNKDVTTT